MSMEDDLFSMFRHMDLGGAGGAKPLMDLMSSLVANYQLGVLKMLRSQINVQIRDLSTKSKAPGTAEMNPFVVLGVGMDASEDEVKQAYRKKAAHAHPDKHPGDEERANVEMAKVNAAYEVIRRFKGWT